MEIIPMAITLIEHKRKIGYVKVNCADWLLCGKNYNATPSYRDGKAFAICPRCSKRTYLYDLYLDEDGNVAKPGRTNVIEHDCNQHTVCIMCTGDIDVFKCTLCGAVSEAHCISWS